MSQQQVYIGIDVSKTTLDVAVRSAPQHWSVANREKGIDRLVSRLQALSPALVALEATGGIGAARGGCLGRCRPAGGSRQSPAYGHSQVIMSEQGVITIEEDLVTAGRASSD